MMTTEHIRRFSASRCRRIFTTVALPVLLLLGARAAGAQTCIKLDPDRDNLSEPDRKAAKMLLAQALERNGQRVASTGCVQEFTVFHVQLGGSVSVTLMGPQGYRTASARGIEDLPNWYDQMVRSLLFNTPMGGSGQAVTRDNVSPTQAAPRRVEADSLWYARLGYGTSFGGGMPHGPALGFGYRYELDNLAIDLSFINLMVGSSSGSDNGGVTGSWIRLQGLYFLDPLSNGSTYLGAGLGWGGAAGYKTTTSSSGIDSATAYTGSGLEGQLTAGYEFLRASTIRMFVQADLTLPFYTSKAAIYQSASGSYQTDTMYLPTMTMALGIGWGRSITRVQVYN